MRGPLLALGSFAAGVVLLVSCGDTTPGETEQGQALKQAVDECGPSDIGLEIADGGGTLHINHRGEDETLGVEYEDVVCVLVRLDVPSAVAGQMGSTRALDGMQGASWDGFAAKWTYHPDTGLDVIVTID